MPFIQNISKAQILSGNHIFPGEKSMLIQIVDPASEFPTPVQQFGEIHQFEFLDLDWRDTDMLEFAITEEQAKKIIKLLRKAYNNDMNVIVQCNAGLCRSGAVCEIGVMMGFEDTNKPRTPNIMIKRKLMTALGWRY